MSHSPEVVHILESYAGSSIRAGAPSDDAVLQLLVRMAFADGQIDDDELSMIRRVVPMADDIALRGWIRRSLAQPLDYERIAEALDNDDRRWMALRFATRMAGRDLSLADRERTMLEQLVAAVGLPPFALERVLREMHGPPADRLDPEVLRRIVDDLGWNAAMAAEGDVASDDLIPVVPPDATPIVRIGVDQAEVIGIYAEGIVGRFLEGPAFLRWREIVGCSRGQGLESSVRIFTEDGRIWSLIDARLGAISLLIDRLYRPDLPSSTRRAPLIQRVTAQRTIDPDENA